MKGYLPGGGGGGQTDCTPPARSQGRPACSDVGTPPSLTQTNQTLPQPPPPPPPRRHRLQAVTVSASVCHRVVSDTRRWQLPNAASPAADTCRWAGLSGMKARQTRLAGTDGTPPVHHRRRIPGEDRTTTIRRVNTTDTGDGPTETIDDTPSDLSPDQASSGQRLRSFSPSPAECRPGTDRCDSGHHDGTNMTRPALICVSAALG